MADLVVEEASIIKESEWDAIQRLKKLILMSKCGTLHTHALWPVRRELGLPDDYRNSIIGKYSDVFRVIYPDTVALVTKDENLVEAEVEKWREREYKEKWLSEFETRYVFPIQFPTGFKIEKGFREKLKNWQRLPYVKPYNKNVPVQVRTCGGAERFEKCYVGILHEFLSLTLEKMVEVERLAHFRSDLSMEVNVRELLLKHPGIFYISTKGNTQTVFLREGYSKGALIEPNNIYAVRRKMLDLVLLGCRNTKGIQPLEKLEEKGCNVMHNQLIGGPSDGDWVIQILESCDDQLSNVNMNKIEDALDKED